MDQAAPGGIRRSVERGLGRVGASRQRLTAWRGAAALAWLVVLPLAVWALVRTLGLKRSYPAVPLLAFTPYVAMLAPLAVAWSLLLGRRLAALTALATALALALAVLPRGLAADPDPGPGPTLRVLSVNLLAGGADVEQLAELVVAERVELLSVQELTSEIARQFEATPIATRLPFSIIDPRADSFGSGLYSAQRPAGQGRTKISGVSGVRMRLRAGAGTALATYAVHPPPPTGSAQVGRLERYLGALPSAGRAGAAPVLIGDFNATLDNAALRDLLGSGYADAGERLGEGLAPTWVSDGPFGLLPPPVTIDHVIYDERLRAIDYEVIPIEGSDHRAVLATLTLPDMRP